jgi:hypothetical protein
MVKRKRVTKKTKAKHVYVWDDDKYQKWKVYHARWYKKKHKTLMPHMKKQLAEGLAYMKKHSK